MNARSVARLALALALTSAAGLFAATPEARFPERPESFPWYLNRSSIRGADLLARHELDQARALTGIDFNLVLLDDIPADQSVEDYASKLFGAWNIGRASGGRGVLILLVEKRNALKIEVGYELESLFTDAFCESFQDQIKLYFASRQFGDVVENLIITMAQYAVRSANGESTGALELPEKIDLARAQATKAKFLSGGGGVMKSDYFQDKDRKLAQILALEPEVAAEFEGSKDADETVKRYLRSLGRGINYPFLGVLLEGSRYMRLEYPKSARFLRQLHDEYAAAGPYRLKFQGDYAVARFRRGAPVFPLFLRRDEQGFWRIDVAKAWAVMARSDDLKSVRMTNTDHPWMFAFPDISFEASKWPPIPERAFPLKLEERIAELEQATREHPAEAANYFALAEVLYWECYWIGGAIDAVEKGLALEPKRADYHWLAIDLRSRYPLLDGIPAHYEALLKIDPNDEDALWAYAHFAREFLRDEPKAARLRARYDALQ